MVNQIIFRFLLRFLRGAGLLKYVNLSRCPLACRAVSYGGLAFSKASLLHDKTDSCSLRLMDSGSCLPDDISGGGGRSRVNV